MRACLLNRVPRRAPPPARWQEGGTRRTYWRQPLLSGELVTNQPRLPQEGAGSPRGNAPRSTSPPQPAWVGWVPSASGGRDAAGPQRGVGSTGGAAPAGRSPVASGE